MKRFLKRKNEEDKSLSRRDDFFGSFFDEMEKLFEDFWGDSLIDTPSTGTRRFSVDISEKDDSFIVEAELPGINEDDLEVKLERDILTISAEKEEENEEEDKNYYRREIRSGRFERRFRLPDNIDKENIKADLKDGILKIDLPKTEESKEVKKIDINKG
ncbi:MAG: Hsp20/alpha crystallin family protein [Candidatus Mcinerneyibacterium aminivorans]|uniref:Hsp20/alpha crystallin family protein n=1 Tax=Candidatus Mcinerneyibacterium aminivorans TaxID=2703815 RepID=A0A5D0MEQ7_9BACT|nr:MAG: Hsp20/alpha crystallin family protein [Candidatus Mcinerneyibacterium aminivorans]